MAIERDVVVPVKCLVVGDRQFRLPAVISEMLP